jgi:hypothetical protein
MPRDREFEELVYLRNENRRLRESLNLLTSPLEALLKRHGFRVFSKNPREDLLLPSEEFIDAYYCMLHRYSFRLFLREVIKYQTSFRTENVVRYAAADVTADYLQYLLSLGIIAETEGGFQLAGRRIRSFGETLEWYAAEILKREFCFESMWGVKFKRPGIGGDYDVLGKFNGSVLYIEVKSSPPKQVYAGEISAFLGRVSDLLPEVAIFFMDTELRMKDKIVPLFETELAKKYTAPPEVTRMEKELFQIGSRIFIINAKDNIVGNIERVLDKYFRR